MRAYTVYTRSTEGAFFSYPGPDGGKIIESGSHDELVNLGGVYAKLYEMQARNSR